MSNHEDKKICFICGRIINHNPKQLFLNGSVRDVCAACFVKSFRSHVNKYRKVFNRVGRTNNFRGYSYG
jgi:ribosome-binding protein aMBF1 (putative translation factor)